MARTGVTIVDVARALGISKTAVSAALHGSGRVSDATRERVLAKASEMGYVSNRAAQRLRGGRHGAIGLSVPGDVRELAFYMELAFGAADAAAGAGSDLLLLADGTGGARRRPSVDGVIIVDPTPAAFAALLDRVGEAPVVSVGAYRGPGRERVAASIAADHAALVREVLEALAAEGVRCPALVALPERREPEWARDVTEGYAGWCAGRDARPLVLRTAIDPDDAALRALLVAASDAGCDGVVWVAQGLVLRALAVWAATPGAHALPMATMAAEPGTVGVTGVDLRAREYGAAAARLLLGALDGTVAAGAREVHAARVIRPAGVPR